MLTQEKKRYLVLISIHGLIRGHNLELGRDADTGGQTKYVVELAQALAERDDVAQVDLLTRRVIDPDVAADYAVAVEQLSDKARIVRIEAGPEEYLRKELLWDHLDSFADNAVKWLNAQPQHPDVVHSHYADAGYVGVRIASLLGTPLVHTGHSLGRVKRRRLLANGLGGEQIEQRYNMTRRVEAEEELLAHADLVITSTHNEIDEQYGMYDHYHPELMSVIPPGTDLERFHPVNGDDEHSTVNRAIHQFLREPDKPMILALSRPDERKNIATLVRAYGESKKLQKKANLVIIAGNRDDISEMDEGAQSVLTELLLLIDQYDLYGKVAYPKHHAPDEVPIIYRLAAASHGVFVNPALTEPFGLTLIEAAASGLPIVATEDGGPTDIIGNCHNGILIDPLDSEAISEALHTVLKSRKKWQKLSENGLKGVREHYSWAAHANSYVHHLTPLLGRSEPLPRSPRSRRPMLYHDRAIFTDLDQNLLGDPDSLQRFAHFIRDNRKCASFGIATGRSLNSALSVMRRYGIPRPDVLITGAGTEIYYAPRLTADLSWARHINYLWNPARIRTVLADIPGLELQPKSEQSRYKVSYYIDPAHAPCIDDIDTLLYEHDQPVTTLLSFGQFLDIIPQRASKGLALRYFAQLWDIPLEHILVAGGSGADEDMMRGNTLAVVVANRHNEELSQLTDADRIYFARKAYAQGIMEAIDHYDFYGECRVPAS